MKITVKKRPKKSAEAYNRFFDGESRGVFLKKIAEAIVHGGKRDADTQRENGRTDSAVPED